MTVKVFNRLGSVRDVICLIAVKEGLKPIGEISVSFSDLSLLYRFLQQENIKHHIVSVIQRKYGKQAWVATIRIWKKDLKIKQLGKALRVTSIWENMYRQGLAYGYPKCCIEQYIKHLKNGKSPFYNYLEKLCMNKRDQSIPVQLTSILHIPCSMDCKESLELGKVYINAIEHCKPADYLLKELANPILFLFRVDNIPWFIYLKKSPRELATRYQEKIRAHISTDVESALPLFYTKPYSRFYPFDVSIYGFFVCIVLSPSVKVTFYNVRSSILRRYTQDQASEKSVANFRIYTYS